MNLLVIFGPSAVGKMTVGQAVAAGTDYRLFHNHMTIDLVLPFFDFGSPPFMHLLREFRRGIVEEAAKAGGPNLTFTCVWPMDHEPTLEEARYMIEPVLAHGGEVYFVELRADLETRLARNRSDNRIAMKPLTKSDVEASEARLLAEEGKWRMESDGDFPYPEQHLIIDNSDLEPGEVAERIIERFKLGRGPDDGA